MCNLGEFQFDVLKEPWITARREDGTIKEFGLIDFFESAHELVDLVEQSPLVKYGIIRLLVAFITDAFRFDSNRELERAIEKGSFDMERIGSYINECKREMGDGCFDLFDENTPFLQNAWDENFDRKEEEYKSVVKLMKEMPAGNNHIHFKHSLETDQAYCPAVCAKGLTVLNIFAIKGGRGLSPGLNGSNPPWYIIVKGENIFTTILFNTITATTIDNSKLAKKIDEPKVIWKDNEIIQSEKKILATSYLRGLTWSARKVRLIPEFETGKCSYSNLESNVLIRKIMLKAGYSSKFFKLKWIDPHVAYYENNDEISIKPSLDYTTWEDIGRIVFGRNRPENLNQYVKLKKTKINPKIKLEFLSLTLTKLGKESEWFEESLDLNPNLLDNPKKNSETLDFIEKTELVSNYLKDQLRNVYAQKMKNSNSKSRKNHSAKASFVEEAMVTYFSIAKECFYKDFLERVENFNEEKENEIEILHKFKRDKIRSIAKEVFSKFSLMLGTRSTAIFAMVEAQRYFEVQLNKILYD
jgi:CRISPR system Cascade subunit CasA